MMLFTFQDLLNHQNQNIVAVGSSNSSITSSSPPESLQHVSGGIMKQTSSITSSNLNDTQNTKGIIGSDQNGLDRDKTVDGLAFVNTTASSATITALTSAISSVSITSAPAQNEEPESNGEETRGNGICAI